MINKKAITKTAYSLINKPLSNFMFNTLMSKKEYKMNEFLYSLLKDRLIDELKASQNYLSFKNQKQGKGVFDYSASLKEVSKTLFDLKSFKENDPKLYEELFSKYSKPSVANVIDANLIRVK